jgi:predicted alpha/beta-hydrolase family hydrolase
MLRPAPGGRARAKAVAASTPALIDESLAPLKLRASSAIACRPRVVRKTAMHGVKLESLEIKVSADVAVAGRISMPEWWPSGQRIGVVLAHDLETRFDDPGIAALQCGLSERSHLVLAFNFPYAQQGRKRPDADALLERAFRAAVTAILRDAEAAPGRIFVGGYGLGARIASQVVAQGLKVEGLICLGFPLHPSGKPNQQRIDALYRVTAPILFVQGARDAHCRIDRLAAALKTIGAPTQLHVIEDCGQGLTLIRRSPRRPEELHAEVLARVEQFVRKVT